MLLSSGGFAVYRYESNVFNLLAPRFGGMRSREDRKQLMKVWLNSELFQRSGLDAQTISARIIEEGHSAAQFLRIVMEEIARNQGLERWADCTPEHLLFMEEIKREIPEALFIHIIRDGRDVALSYIKQGWSHPLPWDRDEQLGAAGLYWEWIVRKGRESGKRMGADYVEVRFEDLILRPRETLSGLGEFVDHDLDYDVIQRAGIGSVSEPNTSFGGESEAFNPLKRWAARMSAQELASFEALVGDFLKELGYSPASEKRVQDFRAMRMRATYRILFEAKQWLKTHSPLGRRVRLDRIQISQPHDGEIPQ